MGEGSRTLSWCRPKYTMSLSAISGQPDKRLHGRIMDIAILGPGALGGLLAAGFRLAGADVRLVDHRPERVELLRGRGLEVTFTDGAVRQVFVPVALPAEAAPCSLVIIAVKAYHTARAAQVLPPLMAPGGLVLTLQNGLGNLEILAQAVGPEPLLAGVSYLGATRPEDGRVIFAGRGPTYLGAPVGSRATAADLAAIAQLFQRAGFPC